MARAQAGRIVECTGFRQPLAVPRDRHGRRRFPSYERASTSPLRRDDCLLHTQVKDGNDGALRPTLTPRESRSGDRHALLLRSPRRRSETAEGDYLEFYVVLERGRAAVLGYHRIALQGVESHENDRLAYVDGSSVTSRSRNARPGSITC